MKFALYLLGKIYSVNLYRELVNPIQQSASPAATPHYSSNFLANKFVMVESNSNTARPIKKLKLFIFDQFGAGYQI